MQSSPLASGQPVNSLPSAPAPSQSNAPSLLSGAANPAPPSSPVSPVVVPQQLPTVPGAGAPQAPQQAAASSQVKQQGPVKGFAIFGRVLYTLFILVPVRTVLTFVIPVLPFYYLGMACAGASKGEIALEYFSPFITQIAGIIKNAKGKSYDVLARDDETHAFKVILKAIDPTLVGKQPKAAGQPPVAPPSAPQTQQAAQPGGPPPPTTLPPPLPSPQMQIGDVKDKAKVTTWLSNPYTNVLQTNAQDPNKLFFLTSIIAHWINEDDQEGQEIVELINKKLTGAHEDDIQDLATELKAQRTPDEIAKIEAKLPKLKT